MTAQPCDPPEYTPGEDDTTALERHFLQPDPHDSTSCKRCGDVNGWGFLHLTERGEFDTDDPQPRLCACGHYTHKDKCWGGVPSYPRPKPCDCQVRSA